MRNISGVSAINPLVALKHHTRYLSQQNQLFLFSDQSSTIVIISSELDLSSSFFFLPLSTKGSVQHVFDHVVIKIRELFLRPAACLMSTLLETGVGANDCKCSWDQQLKVPYEARRSSR
jgi:hypothetical protein